MKFAELPAMAPKHPLVGEELQLFVVFVTTRPMIDLRRWQNKVALVTGASSGIGAAVARRLVENGMTVVATARRKERLQALSESLGEKLIPRVLDVGDEASVESTFAAVEKLYGGLDVLVNNAGVGYGESLLTGQTQHWREMLDVNVLGLALCTREGIRLMRQRPEGHIFNLGSLSGHRVPKGSNMYGATKFAVRSLTESLRLELHAASLPIRVTAISPGYVETEFHARYYADTDRAQDLYSRMKVLEPADIADALCYALGTPPHVQVHDLLLRGVAQGS